MLIELQMSTHTTGSSILYVESNLNPTGFVSLSGSMSSYDDHDIHETTEHISATSKSQANQIISSAVISQCDSGIKAQHHELYEEYYRFHMNSNLNKNNSASSQMVQSKGGLDLPKKMNAAEMQTMNGSSEYYDDYSSNYIRNKPLYDKLTLDKSHVMIQSGDKLCEPECKGLLVEDSDSDAEDFDAARMRIQLNAQEHDHFWQQISQIICACLTAGTIEIGTGRVLGIARVNITMFLFF